MENGSQRWRMPVRCSAFARQHGSERGACTDAGRRVCTDRPLPSLRTILFEVLCGLGLACNFVWCTLEGHADGFLTSAQGFDAVVNSRFFFQLGLALAAAIMFAMPRALQRADKVLVWVLPVLGAFATFLYAWPQRISPAYPEFACVAGLTVSGFVYCWLVARFYLMMARRTDFAGCVVATALCLGSKEVLLSFLSAVPSQDAQTCVAAVMPVLMAALCALAAHMVGENPVESPAPPVVARRRTTFAYALMLALLLGIIRGFSRLGMWGIEAPGALGLGVSGVIALLSVCAVAAFAVFALILPADRGIPRFRPAMLVLLACLFPIAVQTYLGADAIPYVFLQVEELLAHLTFWSATFALICESGDPTLRTPAMPLLVYSVTSAVLVVLMGRTTVLAFVFALFVVYLVFAASGGRASQELPPSAGAQAAAEPKAEGPAGMVALTDAVGQTCEALAATYGLSPREAQILPMVVEGRSRAYICNQLGLSDSTVKTHISHIYGKCSVTGRQGLVNLIYQASRP